MFHVPAVLTRTLSVYFLSVSKSISFPEAAFLVASAGPKRARALLQGVVNRLHNLLQLNVCGCRAIKVHLSAAISSTRKNKNVEEHPMHHLIGSFSCRISCWKVALGRRHLTCKQTKLIERWYYGKKTNFDDQFHIIYSFYKKSSPCFSAGWVVKVK